MLLLHLPRIGLRFSFHLPRRTPCVLPNAGNTRSNKREISENELKSLSLFSAAAARSDPFLLDGREHCVIDVPFAIWSTASFQTEDGREELDFRIRRWDLQSLGSTV